MLDNKAIHQIYNFLLFYTGRNPLAGMHSEILPLQDGIYSIYIWDLYHTMSSAPKGGQCVSEQAASCSSCALSCCCPVSGGPLVAPTSQHTFLSALPCALPAQRGNMRDQHMGAPPTHIVHIYERPPFLCLVRELMELYWRASSHGRRLPDGRGPRAVGQTGDQRMQSGNACRAATLASDELPALQADEGNLNTYLIMGGEDED